MNATDVTEIETTPRSKNEPQTLRELLQTPWFRSIEENFDDMTPEGVKYALRKSRKFLRGDPDNRVVGFFLVDEWGDYSPDKLAEKYWEISSFYKGREAFRLCVVRQYLDNPAMTCITILDAEGKETSLFLSGILSLAKYLKKVFPDAKSTGPMRD